MEKAEIQSGEEIITQGEVEAKYYFVLDSGKAEVIKNGENLPVVYEAGAGFGEQARRPHIERRAVASAHTLSPHEPKRTRGGGCFPWRKTAARF